MKTVELDSETRELIRWLQGAQGRRWSRSVHRQSPYAVHWFSLKADREAYFGIDDDWDELEDEFLVYLGRYDKTGQKFFRHPRENVAYYVKYGDPVPGSEL